MKKGFALLCLLALLLPLPGLILKGPDVFSEDRNENVNAALGFRGEITAVSAALQQLLGMSGSDQVALGKNGVLYLAETLPEAVGQTELTDREIEAIAGRIKALDDALREKGAYLVFLCAPNKASVMKDALPYYARPRQGPGGLDRLQSRLAEMGVRYVDVKGMALETPETAYLLTDTHWTDAFAHRVYKALMAQLPDAAWRDYGDLPLEKSRRLGDLTELIYSQGGPKEEVLQREVPRAYRVKGAMRTVMDMKIETACEANGLRVIVLRDSFANALFPYLANNIGSLRLIRSHHWLDSYWQEGTDAVVLEIVERNLPMLMEAHEE